MISFEPTEEQRMLVDAVRRYAENDIRPVFRDCEEEGQVPKDLTQKGWELGLVASGIPEEYDGFAEEPSAITGALYAEELAWGDLAVALHIMTPGLVAYPILHCERFVHRADMSLPQETQVMHAVRFLN